MLITQLGVIIGIFFQKRSPLITLTRKNQKIPKLFTDSGNKKLFRESLFEQKNEKNGIYTMGNPNVPKVPRFN